MKSKTSEQPPPLEKIRGREIGLKIITKKSTGWPKEQIYIEHIKGGIENGRFKWTYSTTAYEEEVIYQHQINNEIDLNKVWTIVDDSIYRKIRNGLQQEKTPFPDKDIRHKNKTRLKVKTNQFILLYPIKLTHFKSRTFENGQQTNNVHSTA